MKHCSNSKTIKIVKCSRQIKNVYDSNENVNYATEKKNVKRFFNDMEQVKRS